MDKIFTALDKFIVIETSFNGDFRRIWVFDDIKESLDFRQLMANQDSNFVYHCQRSSHIKVDG